MGVTGVGKSTFIEAVTGQDVGIGHSLMSQTSEVGVFPFEYRPSQRIFLIDTPGFDDTTRSDGEVLQDVAYFLGASYSKRVKLAGINYLHPITGERMKGSAIRNLAMFQKLCGESSLEHVVLATTKWENLKDEQIGVDREAELAGNSKFWRTMLDNGSRIFRHQNTRASALKIIDHIMSLRGNMVLDIQRQMIDENSSLDGTSAGQELQREMAAARRKHEKELHDIREGLAAAIKSGNQQLMDEMAQMEEEMTQRLANAEEERKRLQIEFAELQEQGEARYNKRIEELNQPLNKVREEGRKNAEKWRLDAAAKQDESNRKIATLERQDKARREAIAARNEQNGLVSAMQGILGLGLMGTGVLTGMNPFLLATGASMLGDATKNAMASSDEL